MYTSTIKILETILAFVSIDILLPINYNMNNSKTHLATWQHREYV
jgi:hypothetical protein